MEIRDEFQSLLLHFTGWSGLVGNVIAILQRSSATPVIIVMGFDRLGLPFTHDSCWEYPARFKTLPLVPKLCLGTHPGGKLSLLFGGKKRSFPVTYVPKRSPGTRSRVEFGHDGGTQSGACGVTGCLHRPLQRDMSKGQG